MIDKEQLNALKSHLTEQLRPVARPKRNEPCHCGSGRKYKSCHMAADRDADEERRRWESAAQYLRRDLLKFARDERFAPAVADAIGHYWNDYYTVENAEEMSLAESMRFFDWLAFDYSWVIDGQSRRLIEVYRDERGPDLSTHQQRVLDQWIAAPPAVAYELLDYEGQALILQDLVTEQVLAVYEPGGHGITEPGDLLLTRLVPVHDRLQFSTNAAYIPSEEAADLPSQLAAARAAYLTEHPEASEAEFMRAHAHLPIHHALAQAELHGRPPVERLNPDRQDAAAVKAARRLGRLKR
jgi:hypothetical protein